MDPSFSILTKLLGESELRPADVVTALDGGLDDIPASDRALLREQAASGTISRRDIGRVAHKRLGRWVRDGKP